MKKAKSKQEKRKDLIVRILLSFVSILLFGVWIFAGLFVAYDNIFSKSFNVLLSFLFFFMLLLLIWKDKFRNLKTVILMIIIVLLRIGHGYYYDELSMKIEPLVYLQVKYGFEDKDLDILEVQRSTIDFITPGYDRSAKIKYKDHDVITVQHSNGHWVDNYEDILKFKVERTKIYEKLSLIIKKYSANYKILDDLQIMGDLEENTEDFGFIIFLCSGDNDVNIKIIKELDSYVTEYGSSFLSYGLFIVKDFNLYNEMLEKDISRLNTVINGTYGQTSPQEIFDEMGYQYKRITFNHDGYSDTIFKNNGDRFDDEYQNPNKFEDIVFYYNNNFQVFGIND